MWFATTDEEANHIFDLLQDREDTVALERYAQWLDGFDPRRAEFLRLDAAPLGNENRLIELRQLVDSRWLGIVTSRRFRVGDVARILGGPFENIEGTVRIVDAERGRAGLLLHMFARQSGPVWIDFNDLRVIGRNAH